MRLRETIRDRESLRARIARAKRASPGVERGGFTLVEILVVIVILGLVAGLSIALVEPGERDASAREARSFAGALEYAAARAQWRNEMLGVSADGRVLRYWRRDAANDARRTPKVFRSVSPGLPSLRVLPWDSTTHASYLEKVEALRFQISVTVW